MSETYEYIQMPSQITCRYHETKFPGNTDFHLHNHYEIYLLLKGEVDYFVAQTCYHLTPGSLLVFHDHEIHKAANLREQSHKRITIHFNPAYLQSFSTAQTDLLACFHNHKPASRNLTKLNKTQLITYISLADKLISHLNSKQYGSDLLAVTYLIQLLILVNDSYQHSSRINLIPVFHKAQPIMAYIEENILEALTLEKIASSLSLDKYYISHLFKAETGSTIFQYILLKRIALAKELLANGASVTDACMQSGFQDYSNFIRTFKKITGFSPGKYRKLSVLIMIFIMPLIPSVMMFALMFLDLFS